VHPPSTFLRRPRLAATCAIAAAAGGGRAACGSASSQPARLGVAPGGQDHGAPLGGSGEFEALDLGAKTSSGYAEAPRQPKAHGRRACKPAAV